MRRFAATRRMGLRYTRGGFGTPFFGADEQVRLTYQNERAEWEARRLAWLEEVANG